MGDRWSVPHVVCVGIATVDHVFWVDTLPTGDGKYSAAVHQAVDGGVAANAAVTVRRLGGEASFVGCVGDDEAGDAVVTELTELGVVTDSVQQIVGRSTPISSVLVDRDGRRQLVNHVPGDYFERADPSFAGHIGRADVVLVDGRWPAGALVALQAARSRGIPAVVDVDRPVDDDPDTETGRLLDTATHLVYSRDALMGTTGEERLDAALRAAARSRSAWTAVTDGEHGVRWVDGGEIRCRPAFRVDAVDTLAAGDVFHGAFALALAEGRTEPEAVRFAAAAAAAKCARPGGRAGIPDRPTVDAMLATDDAGAGAA